MSSHWERRGQGRFNILESFYADGAEGKLDLSLRYGCGEGFQSPRTFRFTFQLKARLQLIKWNRLLGILQAFF